MGFAYFSAFFFAALLKTLYAAKNQKTRAWPGYALFFAARLEPLTASVSLGGGDLIISTLRGIHL
jgi:hypothetical protein